jgi:hypothetical protein
VKATVNNAAPTIYQANPNSFWSTMKATSSWRIRNRDNFRERHSIRPRECYVATILCCATLAELANP